MTQTNSIVKASIRARLMDFVFNPQREKLVAVLDDIIIENCILLGGADKRIRFKGEVFWHSEASRPQMRSVPKLHDQLAPVMDKFLNDHEEFQLDQMYVKNYFTKIMNATSYVDDMRKVLPECIHDALRGWGNDPQAPRLPHDRITFMIEDNASSIQTIKKYLLINIINN